VTVPGTVAVAPEVEGAVAVAAEAFDEAPLCAVGVAAVVGVVVGGAAATLGAGTGTDKGTDGSWLTCPVRTMWKRCWASDAMRDGVSS